MSTQAKPGDLDWAVERSAWPLAETSQFVQADGLRWHVQQMGAGPTLLLIHGTGASSHSWRTLAPLLAQRFTVVAPDLPGHGFTECPPRRRLSLPAMAGAVAALMEALKQRPVSVVGHSAGAAIGIRCCLDGSLAPASMIGINAALMPFRGPAGVLFPPLARLLFLNPLVPRLFARSAENRDRVMRLLSGTGSELDQAGIDLYAKLFASPAHVAATLGMMAHWDLHRFARRLPALKVPLWLIAGDNDKTVPPTDADRIRAMVPGARVRHLAGLGHLAHEENPEQLAELIFELAKTSA